MLVSHHLMEETRPLEDTNDEHLDDISIDLMSYVNYDASIVMTFVDMENVSTLVIFSPSS